MICTYFEIRDDDVTTVAIIFPIMRYYYTTSSIVRYISLFVVEAAAGDGSRQKADLASIFWIDEESFRVSPPAASPSKMVSLMSKCWTKCVRCSMLCLSLFFSSFVSPSSSSALLCPVVTSWLLHFCCFDDDDNGRDDTIHSDGYDFDDFDAEDAAILLLASS